MISKTEFQWREWRLGEGRWRGKGPKSQPRPAWFPMVIPPAWFARLALFLKRRTSVPVQPPAPQLGAFGRPFAFYRNPQGGVESVGRAHGAGLRTALLNIGDHSTSSWSTVTARMDTWDITWGYWWHCRTMAHIEQLLAASVRNKRPIVGINVEAELGGALGPWVIRDCVARSGFQGQVATVLMGWVQNNVDCRPIGDWVAMLEIFPQDAAELWDPKVKVYHCLEHARNLGLKLPVPFYATYPMRPEQRVKIGAIHPDPPTTLVAQPSWYDRTLMHGLYTVDDTAEDWDTWRWPS